MADSHACLESSTHTTETLDSNKHCLCNPGIWALDPSFLGFFLRLFDQFAEFLDCLEPQFL